MAKLEVILDGNSKGLSNAMGQASSAVTNATNKINKGLKASKEEIAAWDAAARKASQQSGGIISPKLAEQAAAQAKAAREAASAQSQLANSTQRYAKAQGSSNMVASDVICILQVALYGINVVQTYTL